MVSSSYHEFSQIPTGVEVGNIGGRDTVWPIHSKQHSPPGLEDEGMVGHHRADKVTLHNAHPHQSHSVGYEDSTMGTTYENHGFEAVHIMHGKRDKGPEHHPPKGLWEPNAVDHTPKR